MFTLIERELIPANYVNSMPMTWQHSVINVLRYDALISLLVQPPADIPTTIKMSFNLSDKFLSGAARQRSQIENFAVP